MMDITVTSVTGACRNYMLGTTELLRMKLHITIKEKDLNGRPEKLSNYLPIGN